MLIQSFILAASIVIATPALACTGISLTTINNNYIQARTIEWGNNPLNSRLIIAPRDYSYTSTMPDQKRVKVGAANMASSEYLFTKTILSVRG